MQLTPRLASGAYLGSADVVGPTSGPIGRFFADHLDVQLTTPGCGAFTYDRQPFTALGISARAANGNLLQNYRGSNNLTLSFARPVTLADTTGNGVVTVAGNATAAATDFTNGSANLAGARAATFTFNANPSPPANIAIAATDTDASPAAGAAAQAAVRSGRVRLDNDYGSELLDLPVRMQSEFWNGGWLLNTADSCTQATLAFAPPIGAADRSGNTCVLETANNSGRGCAVALGAAQANRGYLEGGEPDFAGNFNLWLRAPNNAAPGALTLNTIVPPWLQFNWSGAVGNPRARAAFGNLRSPLIYRRENY